MPAPKPSGNDSYGSSNSTYANPISSQQFTQTFYNSNGGHSFLTTSHLGSNATYALTTPFHVFFVAYQVSVLNDYGYIICSSDLRSVIKICIINTDINNNYNLTLIFSL